MSQSSIPRIFDFAHYLIGHRLKVGDVAIDATMGNGHDTVFMAQLVGPTGRIHAFDIQAQALHNTQQRLDALGLSKQVTLWHQSHTTIARVIQKTVAVIVFNLGYLPGQAKTITTQAASTLCALQQSMGLLMPLGLLIIVVYPGHPQGQREKEQLDSWVKTLNPRQYAVLRYQVENTLTPAPYLLAIEKKVLP